MDEPPIARAPDEYERQYMDAARAVLIARVRQRLDLRLAMMALVVAVAAFNLQGVLVLAPWLWALRHEAPVFVYAVFGAYVALGLSVLWVPLAELAGAVTRVVLTPTHLRVHRGRDDGRPARRRHRCRGRAHPTVVSGASAAEGTGPARHRLPELPHEGVAARGVARRQGAHPAGVGVPRRGRGAERAHRGAAQRGDGRARRARGGDRRGARGGRGRGDRSGAIGAALEGGLSSLSVASTQFARSRTTPPGNETVLGRLLVVDG
nr:hypothetical protein [Deltaproteobacteria bacterium]